MLFLHYVSSKTIVPKWHNKHERVETKLLHQCMVQLAAKFPYNPILHYAYFLLKENSRALNRLHFGLYALFYRTRTKIMLPPQAQNVQYRFLRRSRRLYWNQKSPISCQSSVSSVLGRSRRSGQWNGNQDLVNTLSTQIPEITVVCRHFIAKF